MLIDTRQLKKFGRYRTIFYIGCKIILMDPVTGTAILGGANLISQSFANRANRRWATRQADKARAWALQDWEMTNEYNSPRAQMERLKEAGLNPNLVYGNGATATGGDVRGTAPASYKQEPLDFSPMQNAIYAGIDMEIKKANKDLLEVQKTVATNNAILTAQKTAESQIKMAKSEFELSQAKSLAAGVLQAQQLNLKKMEQDIDLQGKRFLLDVNENDRRNILTANTLREGLQRIVESKSRVYLNGLSGKQKIAETDRIRKQIDLMNQDDLTKELDNNLRKEGISPNDPTWMRVIIQQAKKWFPEIFN